MKNLVYKLLLVVYLLAYTNSFALDYTSISGGYTIKLADTWINASNEQVKLVNKTFQKIGSGTNSSPIVSIFIPTNGSISDYPYILTSEHKLNTPIYEYLKKLFDKRLEISTTDLVKTIENTKFLKENVKTFNIQNPIILKKEGLILIPLNAEIGGTSVIGLTAVFIGNKNAISFKFYAKSEKYDKEVVLFENMVKSFKFQNGYELTQNDSLINTKNISLDIGYPIKPIIHNESYREISINKEMKLLIFSIVTGIGLIIVLFITKKFSFINIFNLVKNFLVKASKIIKGLIFFMLGGGWILLYFIYLFVQWLFGWEDISKQEATTLPTRNHKTSTSEYREFHGNDCKYNCDGHEAGYNWAEEKGISDVSDCENASSSFDEGCTSYVEESY